jgi:hypothetical protein
MSARALGRVPHKHKHTHTHTQMRVYIQVHLKLLAKFQECASHDNKNKNKFISVVSANNFRVTAPPSLDLNPLDVYLWVHLKPLAYSAPIKNKHFLMPIKPFATVPGLLKCCDNL